MSNEPKYPQIHVKLVGEDGNAFSILGRCSYAMRQAGLSKDELDEFHEKATSGDYNKLLQTVLAYFTCDEQNEEEYDFSDGDGGRGISR